jgi:hypothetical protein
MLLEIRRRMDAHEGLPWLSGYTDHGSYRPASAASAKDKGIQTGPWLTIIVDVAMSGTTMDQTTDRASGDPYSAYVHYDWIGLFETAPKKVTTPEELDEWAVYNSMYVRENTDVGSWGVHSGSYVTGLDEDGTLTIREASGRFEDVDPSEETTEKTIKLKK